MKLLRSDLPLVQDASGRFLPWIIGFMVYLAALTLGGAMAVEKTVSHWHAGLAGALTVQIAPADGERAARIETAVRFLTAVPEVAGAEVLDDDDLARLLEPWLGPEVAEMALPLPDLIGVTLRPGAMPDLDALRRGLAAAVPGATLDDHQRWLGDLVVFARSLELLAFIVVALVGFAAAVTVVFVTRTGLAIHRRVIEIVHLIGARDAYIAAEFQIHALRLGLLGGALGVALAALTLAAIDAMLGRLDALLMPPLSLDPWQWLVLASLPVAAAVIAMVTARYTVLRSLDRIM